MNNSNLSIFNFESNKVRILFIDGEIWFVAKDICLILGINNVSQALSRLDVDEVSTITLNDGISAGNPNMNIISESGMYALVLSSRKPEAKVFRKWVTSEILPTLRKEGTYSIKPMSPAELIIAQGQAMLALEQKQAQLEAEQARLAQVVALEAQRTSDIEALVIQHDAELDRVFNPNGHYFSVMGYCSLKGKPVSVKQAAVYGRKASKYCKQNNIQIEPVTDPRFGKVNTYPEQVLAQII